MDNASKLDWQQRVGKEHVERGDTALAGHVVDGQYGGEPVVPAAQMAALWIGYNVLDSPMRDE